MRAADIVTASILIIFGGLVLVDAVRLGIGWGTDGPKSGFFPFWLALILTVSGGLIILQQARNASSQPFVTRDKLSRVLTVLWPATAAVLLIQFIGLYVAAALYIGFYMKWVGGHSWSAVLLVAIGVPAFIFLIFENWFLIPMPKGPLEAWLGY
jgi:putative tricarboxylic transport membrane protein